MSDAIRMRPRLRQQNPINIKEVLGLILSHERVNIIVFNTLISD